MHKMRAVYGLLLLLVAIALADVDLKDAKKQVKKQHNAFKQRYNQKENDELSMLYTEDCLLQPYSLEPYHGRAGVVEYAEHLQEQGVKKLDLSLVQLAPLSQGVCDPVEQREGQSYFCEHGAYKFIGQNNRIKQNGDYWIVWEISNDNVEDALILTDKFHDPANNEI